MHDVNGKVSGDLQGMSRLHMRYSLGLLVLATLLWQAPAAAEDMVSPDRLSTAQLEALGAFAREHLHARTTGGEPAVVAPDLKLPYEMVFVTIFVDGRIRACQGRGGGASFAADLAGAVDRCIDDKRFGGALRPDEAGKATLKIDILHDGQTLKRFSVEALREGIEPGIHAFGLRKDGANAIFKASVPVKKSYSIRTAFERLSRKAGLAKDAYRQPGASIRRWRDTAFLVRPDGSALPLYRGSRLVPQGEVTLDRLGGALALTAAYFRNHVREDGPGFDYLYDPFREKTSRSDNHVRQLASLWIAAKVANVLRDEALAASVRDSLVHYELLLDRRSRSSFPRINGQANLAYSAFCLLALLEQPTYPRQRILVEELARGILSRQREDGSFSTSFDGESDRGWRYYSGEALLALMELYRVNHDEDLREAARKAFPYYRERWRQERNTAMIPWHSQAGRILYEEEGAPEIAEFIFEMNDWLIETCQKRRRSYRDEAGGFGKNAPGTCSTACYLEGIADACQVARDAGRTSDANRYFRSLRRGLRFLLQAQYDEENTYCLERADLAIGGFRNNLRDSRIRIDCVQHAAHAILKAMDQERKGSPGGGEGGEGDADGDGAVGGGGGGAGDGGDGEDGGAATGEGDGSGEGGLQDPDGGEGDDDGADGDGAGGDDAWGDDDGDGRGAGDDDDDDGRGDDGDDSGWDGQDDEEHDGPADDHGWGDDDGDGDDGGIGDDDGDNIPPDPSGDDDDGGGGGAGDDDSTGDDDWGDDDGGDDDDSPAPPDPDDDGDDDDGGDDDDDDDGGDDGDDDDDEDDDGEDDDGDDDEGDDDDGDDDDGDDDDGDDDDGDDDGDDDDTTDDDEDDDGDDDDAGEGGHYERFTSYLWPKDEWSDPGEDSAAGEDTDGRWLEVKSLPNYSYKWVYDNEDQNQGQTEIYVVTDTNLGDQPDAVDVNDHRIGSLRITPQYISHRQYESRNAYDPGTFWAQAVTRMLTDADQSDDQEHFGCVRELAPGSFTDLDIPPIVYETWNYAEDTDEDSDTHGEQVLQSVSYTFWVRAVDGYYTKDENWQAHRVYTMSWTPSFPVDETWNSTQDNWDRYSANDPFLPSIVWQSLRSLYDHRPNNPAEGGYPTPTRARTAYTQAPPGNGLNASGRSFYIARPLADQGMYHAGEERYVPDTTLRVERDNGGQYYSSYLVFNQTALQDRDAVYGQLRLRISDVTDWAKSGHGFTVNAYNGKWYTQDTVGSVDEGEKLVLDLDNPGHLPNEASLRLELWGRGSDALLVAASDDSNDSKSLILGYTAQTQRTKGTWTDGHTVRDFWLDRGDGAYGALDYKLGERPPSRVRMRVRIETTSDAQSSDGFRIVVNNREIYSDRNVGKGETHWFDIDPDIFSGQRKPRFHFEPYGNDGLNIDHDGTFIDLEYY